MTFPLLRKVRAVLRRPMGRLSMLVGRASSITPLCANFGYSRGTPIDRHYIEGFLAKHAQDVRERVLEIKDDNYSRRFGSGRITRQDILDINPANSRATIVGDLALEGVLPKADFDCILLTQTLQFLFDLPAAIAQLHAALAPDGVLLITAPGISPLERRQSGADWCWSLTEASLRRLLLAHFEPRNVEVSSYGNLFAATAFLHGAALEEVPKAKLEPIDPAYPIVLAARAKLS
jgi:SAM-dependent methyltransferase